MADPGWTLNESAPLLLAPARRPAGSEEEEEGKQLPLFPNLLPAPLPWIASDLDEELMGMYFLG